METGEDAERKTLPQTPPSMLVSQQRLPFGPGASESFREAAASSWRLGIRRFGKTAEKSHLCADSTGKECVFSGVGGRLTLTNSSEHFCGSYCVPQERVPALGGPSGKALF